MVGGGIGWALKGPLQPKPLCDFIIFFLIYFFYQIFACVYEFRMLQVLGVRCGCSFETGFISLRHVSEEPGPCG